MTAGRAGCRSPATCRVRSFRSGQNHGTRAKGAKATAWPGRSIAGVLGALIFGGIISGFTFLRRDAYCQAMAKGGIIVRAVVLDQWRQRRAAMRA